MELNSKEMNLILRLIEVAWTNGAVRSAVQAQELTALQSKVVGQMKRAVGAANAAVAEVAKPQ